MIRHNLNINNLLGLYQSGMSEKKLAEKLNVSRSVIRRRLIENNISPRGRSESMYIRMSQTSKEERAHLTKAAHDAVRGTRQSFEYRCKVAKTREINRVGIGLHENICLELLQEYGLSCIPQKAIGPYNVDIAITKPAIIVEIFGGQWHTSDGHARGFRKRFDYILNQGWIPIIIWVTKYYPLGIGAIKYVVTLAEKMRRGEPMRRKEQMITGDGKPTVIGEYKLNNWPLIPGPQPRDNITGRFKSRAGE